MTDLTELWDKGKLPEGDYYIKRRNGIFLYDNIDSRGVWRNSIDEDIVEVLAPVPTFEEWQASEKYNKHLEEKIKIYERKDKQATETSIAYNELLEENTQLKEQINHLSKTQARQFADNQKLQVKAGKAKDVVNIDTARQIIQLKDLLEECRECVDENLEFSKSIGRNRIHPRNKGLLKRIDEVLK